MKKLKKIFFYILGGSISFLYILNDLYKIIFPSPSPGDICGYCLYENISDLLLLYIKYFLGFIEIIILPIIFLIGLYFYLAKKDKKERGIKYMKRATILAVIVFLLYFIVNWIFNTYFIENF